MFGSFIIWYLRPLYARSAQAQLFLRWFCARCPGCLTPEMPPRRRPTERPSPGKGTYKRDAEKGRHVGFAQFAYEHRARAESWSPDTAQPCPTSCRLGRACAAKLTKDNMLRAHNKMFSTSSAGVRKRRGGKETFSCSLTFPQVKDRRLRCIQQGLASHEAGTGFTVDGVGPVCAPVYRTAHGIPECTWNKTCADLRAGRLQAVETAQVQESTIPAALVAPAAVTAAVVPPPHVAIADAAAAAAAAAAVVAAAPIAAAPPPSLASLPFPSSSTAAAPTLQHMVDALRRAPRDELIYAVSQLHASALERGLLLVPSEQLARRGRSAVNLSTLPSVCSVCEEAGQWRDGPHTDSLICCNECLTVIHQSFVCSYMDPQRLEDEGWTCAECDPHNTRLLSFVLKNVRLGADPCCLSVESRLPHASEDSSSSSTST